MIYQTVVDRQTGVVRKKVLRNCDRCATLADAKGKFRTSGGADGQQFWRRLAEWLMEPVETITK